MNWFILIVAGLFEVGWAVGLKYTEGFTRPWPTLGSALAMVISLGLLGLALLLAGIVGLKLTSA